VPREDPVTAEAAAWRCAAQCPSGPGSVRSWWSISLIRVAKLDVVGVVTLGMITALGGGIIRDILIDSLPPATFGDWRYLLVAAAGSLLAFGFSHRLARMAVPILILDAGAFSP